MVLEAILNPKKAEDKPWTVLVISIIFSMTAIFLSYTLFPSQASILSVAFVTIFFVPFFQRLFTYEEKKDEEIAAKKIKKSDNIFKRHQRVIFVYGAFFLGIIIVYSFVFTFFPFMKEVFSLQMDWFKGFVTSEADFAKYFFNNTQVMMIFFVLSVIFGAGAVFILSWNASIIAVYLGMVVNKFIPALGVSTAYVYGFTVGISSIILHAIPEIGGYFFAGIAGGILSVALIRERFMSKEFKEVGKDAMVWLILAEFLIIAGAAIEAVL